ncbi:MAG: hypothetical protein ISR85_04860 [Kiritimatiellales bacterium]|nr:hypothetical protein [Kiritimatiellota bacterium]MBL7012241.1 hypothetical protein [Kiritimatiellales bacterium]
MKLRLQLTPALVAATVCALLWFAAWLIPFRPTPQREIIPLIRPAVCFWPGGAETIREIRSPSLFALPSEQGFSGNFPESRINLLVPSAGDIPGIAIKSRITPPEHPAQNESYLMRNPVVRTQPDTVSLLETIPRLTTDLPFPNVRPASIIPQPDRIALFLSPELRARSDAPPQLAVPGELPASVRIHLSIRPDGTVDQALFETPVQNDALAGAIRQLRFEPATVRTEGWLELRFTPGGDT